MNKIARFLIIIALALASPIHLWGDYVIYPPYTINKYNQAVELYNAGKLMEASDLFVIIVRETVSQPELFETRVMSTQYLGIIYRDLKDYERSNKWFHSAIVMVNKHGEEEHKDGWLHVLANEVKINHELISLVEEQEHLNEERRQGRSTFLILFVVLLMVTLAVIGYMYYQLRKTNQTLAKKNLEWSQKFSVFETSPAESQPDSMREITDYIEKEKAYLKPDLCLDDLCYALGKNRSYISREFSRRQTNFKSVVNEYRIKDAIMLLVSHPEMSIDEVWESSGFNSRTTFYTTFSEATGLSPSAFKKSKLNPSTASQDE